MMSSQELETAVRLKLDLVVLILQDDAYGMIRWKQAVDGHPDFGMTFGNPDFVAYAAAYGVKGSRVESADGLVPTLEAASRIADRSEERRYPLTPQRIVHDVRRVMPEDGIVCLDNEPFAARCRSMAINGTTPEPPAAYREHAPFGVEHCCNDGRRQPRSHWAGRCCSSRFETVGKQRQARTHITHELRMREVHLLDGRRKIAHVQDGGAVRPHKEWRLLDGVVAYGDDQVGAIDRPMHVVPLR
jgi:hypothetical protein